LPPIPPAPTANSAHADAVGRGDSLDTRPPFVGSEDARVLETSVLVRLPAMATPVPVWVTVNRPVVEQARPPTPEVANGTQCAAAFAESVRRG
jgi:hypothetical protein